MSNESTGNRLHLPDLSITGFRGIDHLSIPRLGRVTLLAGRNGVGKTTALEAIRIYAARGRLALLNAVLTERDEFASAFDEDHDPLLSPDLSSLFSGRAAETGQSISIGPKQKRDSLTIQVASPFDLQREQLDLFADLALDTDFRVLRIEYGKWIGFLPWTITQDEYRTRQARRSPASRMPRRRLEEEWPKPIECQTLGPGLLSNRALANLWNNVALTEDEEYATEALQMVRGNGIVRVAVVGDDRPHFRPGQRVIVRLSDQPGPVPLKSLGDGATRIFGVALALANSRNGFLVIDEAENGIHYSIQEDFWHMVLKTAHNHNVQVLATTHSWDCVKGFARAAAQLDDIEGVLVRIERNPEGVRAVQYTEDELKVAADQRIEVR